MSIYLDEKNPGKHKPFEDASPDVIRSGTSIAAAYAAGCSILLLEWSYDRMDVRTIMEIR